MTAGESQPSDLILSRSTTFCRKDVADTGSVHTTVNAAVILDTRVHGWAVYTRAINTRVVRTEHA